MDFPEENHPPVKDSTSLIDSLELPDCGVGLLQMQSQIIMGYRSFLQSHSLPACLDDLKYT